MTSYKFDCDKFDLSDLWKTIPPIIIQIQTKLHNVWQCMMSLWKDEGEKLEKDTSDGIGNMQFTIIYRMS